MSYREQIKTIKDKYKIEIVIFSLCICIYFVTSGIYNRVIPTGDQPHYLIITQTILKYHSVDVMKDYNNKDYFSFYPSLIIPHVTKNTQGKLLPQHGIGGPVIWIAPFLLLKKLGVMLFMSVLTALIVLNIYRLLIETHIRKDYAFLVTLIITIASPIYLYSHMMFVEPFGELIAIYGLRKVIQTQVLNKIELLFLGILFGGSIWIHARFAYFIAPLFLLILYKLYKQNKFKNLTPYLWYFLPITISFVLMELYTISVWKTFNPLYYTLGESSNFNINLFKGLFGIFFDKTSGIVINFPIYLFMFAGLYLSIKNKVKGINGYIAVITLPYLLLIGFYTYWNGGWATPGRYILVLLPIFTYYIAYFLENVHNAYVRILLGISIAVGFIYNIVTALFWPFGFEAGIDFYIHRLATALATKSKISFLISVFLIACIVGGIFFKKKIESVVRNILQDLNI